jgi:hypothetical protein
VRIRNCLWLKQGLFFKCGEEKGEASVENVVAMRMRCVTPKPDLKFRFCTIPGTLETDAQNVEVHDSVVGAVTFRAPGNKTIECCDVVTNEYSELAKPGKNCWSANPQFRDENNFDYQLLPSSPCKGKASDGGDIGCRYTPAMIEMYNIALELRRRGIIKF